MEQERRNEVDAQADAGDGDHDPAFNLVVVSVRVFVEPLYASYMIQLASTHRASAFSITTSTSTRWNPKVRVMVAGRSATHMANNARQIATMSVIMCVAWASRPRLPELCCRQFRPPCG